MFREQRCATAPWFRLHRPAASSRPRHCTCCTRGGGERGGGWCLGVTPHFSRYTAVCWLHVLSGPGASTGVDFHDFCTMQCLGESFYVTWLYLLTFSALVQSSVFVQTKVHECLCSLLVLGQKLISLVCNKTQKQHINKVKMPNLTCHLHMYSGTWLYILICYIWDSESTVMYILPNV